MNQLCNEHKWKIQTQGQMNMSNMHFWDGMIHIKRVSQEDITWPNDTLGVWFYFLRFREMFEFYDLWPIGSTSKLKCTYVSAIFMRCRRQADAQCPSALVRATENSSLDAANNLASSAYRGNFKSLSFMHQSFVTPWVTPPGWVGKMWGFYVDFTRKKCPTGRGISQILHPLRHWPRGKIQDFTPPGYCWVYEFTADHWSRWVKDQFHYKYEASILPLGEGILQ